MVVDDLWYKNAVFYEIYLRAFCDGDCDGHGDLRGLMDQLDYFQQLGVDCLWLLPIYPSPLKDDGYDIADYYGVLPEYGSLEDFKALIDAAHARGLRVIADLVLNHTSDQHPWFRAARSDRNSPYRDYYVWSDTDQKYSQARIIFLDTENSNWTWDEVAGQYFWHRFYSSQPDLNYDNPAVQQEMFEVARFWLELGIDGFRADAVPYLFEREGSNCENLPETHAYLKRLRRYIDKHYPGRILLCEANQWPEDVRLYFGDGDEFHMGFHFPVMPRIFMALRKGDRSPLVWIMGRTPPIPHSCQWCTFLRNHDELTLEMVTEEERQWIWQEYAPDPRMRLNLGIRRRLAPLLDNDRRLIELANSLLFSLPGSPVIYYGDEIGMGDNIWLPDRNGVRTPMQWQAGPGGGFSDAPPERLYSPLIASQPYAPEWVNVAAQKADPGSLWNLIRRMIHIRKQRPAFGYGSFRWAETGSEAVAAYWREHQGDQLLILNNLSNASQKVVLSLSAEPGLSARDLLSELRLPLEQSGQLVMTLKPYQYCWLQFD
ncbi:MAG: maltose alpha-D-glucosyltransferase [Anaerolineales bacterium]|nr:maltose alpha-D-glucosyltransferase [Anaerolineales bacterium]